MLNVHMSRMPFETYMLNVKNLNANKAFETKILNVENLNANKAFWD